MSKLYTQRLINALLLAILLVATPVSILQAANESAPAAQTRATRVSGTLPGGEFAKIWLGLEPGVPNASIRVFAEWDRPNAAANGLNFFVLDPVGLGRAQAGTQVSAAAVAGGNPVFEGADNQMEARFNAFGLTNYTLVVVNDSNEAASFTISVENATIVDDSDQVVNPDAPAATEDATAEGETAEGDATGETAATDETATADATTTEESAAADTTATDTAAPAASTAPTTTTTATTTAATTTATTAPVSTTPQVVRETMLEGDLAPDTIHYLGLETSQRDGTVELSMNVNPADNSEVLRRTNFFVIPTNELSRLSASTRLSDVAIAAGNRVFGGAANERKASFQAVGTGPYTVLVQNTSQDVTVNYSLTVDGGILVDDSSQTKTAQEAATTAAPAATAGTDADSTDTAAAPVTSTTTTTATATTTTPAVTREGEPGGTYTIQSGDTLSLIARDIYGNLRLYTQICAFNELTDCNRIEVGDVINLPTQAQIDALGSTTTTTTAAAADTTADATTNITSTATTTSTTPAAATTAATGAVTSTITSGAGDIVDIITGSEDFTQLVAAVGAAGLTDALKGSGPFTLFAPTDAAFNALPAGALDTLLADPGGPLTNILLYHVVPGRLMQEGLTDGLNAQTVDGRTVQFSVNGGAVTVNDASIIVSDIEATNGVIHVIDTVLSPAAEGADASGATDTASAAAASTEDAAAADTQGIIDNLPVLTDASDLQSSEQNGNATVEYKSQMTIAEAAEFYDEQMTRLGYETATSVVTAQAATFSFTNDTSDIRLSITPDTADETAIVVIITVVAS